MKTIRGVMGIVYSKQGNENYFLLLHRVLNWKGWEFPKGRIDVPEKPEKAVLREIREETGLKNLRIVKKLDFQVNYKIGQLQRTNDVFLVEADMKERVVLQTGIIEHDSFKWVKAEEAKRLLTFPDLHKALDNAISYLL